MSLFKVSGEQIKIVSEKKIDLERNIQKLTEKNLGQIFGPNLTFVCSEFAVQSFRLDTLAFDQENKSFVIIEYKRDKSSSVVDQGFAYLASMLNNKAKFVLSYNNKFNTHFGEEDVDWSQSKVLFIAQNFNAHQQHAINFINIPIELWEVKLYDDDLVSFSQLVAPFANESIDVLSTDKTIAKVTREVRKTTVEDHIKNKPVKMVELFRALSERIIVIDQRTVEVPVKAYIGYQINQYNFAAVRIRTNKLIIHLPRCQAKELDDPEKIVHDVPNSFENFNQHISEFSIANEDDLEYATMLIYQAYQKLVKTHKI